MNVYVLQNLYTLSLLQNDWVGIGPLSAKSIYNIRFWITLGKSK